MARPKLTDDQKRSVNFTIRLTPGEVKKLEALALAFGRTPGSFIREKIFRGKLPETKFARIDRDTYIELKKIGVNINQLTRKANANILPYGLVPGLIKLQRQQERVIKLLLDDSESKDR